MLQICTRTSAHGTMTPGQFWILSSLAERMRCGAAFLFAYNNDDGGLIIDYYGLDNDGLPGATLAEADVPRLVNDAIPFIIQPGADDIPYDKWLEWRDNASAVCAAILDGKEVMSVKARRINDMLKYQCAKLHNVAPDDAIYDTQHHRFVDEEFVTDAAYYYSHWRQLAFDLQTGDFVKIK